MTPVNRPETPRPSEATASRQRTLISSRISAYSTLTAPRRVAGLIVFLTLRDETRMRRYGGGALARRLPPGVPERGRQRRRRILPMRRIETQRYFRICASRRLRRRIYRPPCYRRSASAARRATAQPGDARSCHVAIR